MSCNSCKYAVFVDNGYSNYTVMGTDFFCAMKLHPADGFDSFYGKDKGFLFGDTCEGKVEGDPIGMDVDGENYADFSDEEKVIWAMYQS